MNTENMQRAAMQITITQLDEDVDANMRMSRSDSVPSEFASISSMRSRCSSESGRENSKMNESMSPKEVSSAEMMPEAFLQVNKLFLNSQISPAQSSEGNYNTPEARNDNDCDSAKNLKQF